MLKKLKPVIDLPGGSPSGWVGFHFKEVTTPPTNAMSAEESEVLLLSMEDVIACLGFSTADNPLTKVAKYPKVRCRKEQSWKREKRPVRHSGT